MKKIGSKIFYATFFIPLENIRKPYAFSCFQGGDKKVPVKPDIFRILKAQSAFTCSKLIIEILEQGVRYVQS